MGRSATEVCRGVEDRSSLRDAASRSEEFDKMTVNLVGRFLLHVVAGGKWLRIHEVTGEFSPDRVWYCSLEHLPVDLNREDSQSVVDERVCRH